MCACFTFNLLPTLLMLILSQLHAQSVKSFAPYWDMRPGYHNRTVDTITRIVDFIAGFSIYLSSLVNGIIYIIRDGEYRQQFKLIILKQQPQQRQSNTSVLSSLSEHNHSLPNRNSSAMSAPHSENKIHTC